MCIENLTYAEEDKKINTKMWLFCYKSAFDLNHFMGEMRTFLKKGKKINTTMQLAAGMKGILLLGYKCALRTRQLSFADLLQVYVRI